MKVTYWLSGVAGAFALGTFSLAAQAAPLGTAATGPNAGSGAESMVDNVARRCWRHRGHLHCERGYRRGYRYYYGGPSYYGPGFSFYYGGGRRHLHGHRHRHW